MLGGEAAGRDPTQAVPTDHPRVDLRVLGDDVRRRTGRGEGDEERLLDHDDQVPCLGVGLQQRGVGAVVDARTGLEHQAHAGRVLGPQLEGGHRRDDLDAGGRGGQHVQRGGVGGEGPQPDQDGRHGQPEHHDQAAPRCTAYSRSHSVSVADGSPSATGDPATRGAR